MVWGECEESVGRCGKGVGRVREGCDASVGRVREASVCGASVRRERRRHAKRSARLWGECGKDGGFVGKGMGCVWEARGKLVRRVRKEVESVWEERGKSAGRVWAECGASVCVRVWSAREVCGKYLGRGWGSCAGVGECGIGERSVWEVSGKGVGRELGEVWE
eukprot:3814610-Rhodomonas_salina.1